MTGCLAFSAALVFTVEACGKSDTFSAMSESKALTALMGLSIIKSELEGIELCEI